MTGSHREAYWQAARGVLLDPKQRGSGGSTGAGNEFEDAGRGELSPFIAVGPERGVFQ